MRCKKHFAVDVSSTIGVCASCLRERLCSFINSDSSWPHQIGHPPSPPIVYRNESLPCRNLQQIRLFSTPQVDLTRKNKKSKFRAISNLFRSRSAKAAPVPGFIYPSAIGRKMSPAVGESDSDAESVSPVRFGCSPEPWKKTPSSTRASRIGVCLSPLMRPSPMRKGGAVEVVHSGEIRSTVKPHISTAGSWSSNRSRKLADFGKVKPNR